MAAGVWLSNRHVETWLQWTTMGSDEREMCNITQPHHKIKLLRKCNSALTINSTGTYSTGGKQKTSWHSTKAQENMQQFNSPSLKSRDFSLTWLMNWCTRQFIVYTVYCVHWRRVAALLHEACTLLERIHSLVILEAVVCDAVELYCVILNSVSNILSRHFISMRGDFWITECILILKGL